MSLADNWICIAFNGGKEAFPCSAGPMEAVSVSVATGALALLFTIYLTHKVNVGMCVILAAFCDGANRVKSVGC